MDLGIIILSEVSQRKTVSYDIAYMWNLLKKNDRQNELIYKTDSLTWRMNLWLPGEKGGEGGINRYTLLYLK